jgi:hypothetical protein
MMVVAVACPTGLSHETRYRDKISLDNRRP